MIDRSFAHLHDIHVCTLVFAQLLMQAGALPASNGERARRGA